MKKHIASIIGEKRSAAVLAQKVETLFDQLGEDIVDVSRNCETAKVRLTKRDASTQALLDKL